MKIITLPDNTIVGPFKSLELLDDGNYLADESIMTADQVVDGVVSEVSDDYKHPEILKAENEAFNAEQKQKRYVAYTKESDPIFFKSQRGEATEQDWLDKIAEINAQHPYKV